MSRGTGAQQAEFDSFFEEEDEVNPKMMSNAGLSGSIQPMQSSTVGITSQHQQQQQQQQPNNGGEMSWWRSCFHIFAIETYQPFFDVDSIDIHHRVISSLKYFNETNGFWNKVLPLTTSRNSTNNELPYPGHQQPVPGRKDSAIKGPDLYGPFWIATTLILVVAMTSNLQNYLTQPQGYQENYDYDVKLLVHAIWILYGYILVIPLFFFLVINCLLENGNASNNDNSRSYLPSLVDLISLYGYSLPPFFAGTIISGILPFTVIQWIALVASTLVSMTFILRNLVSSVMGNSLVYGRSGVVEQDSFNDEDDEVESPRTSGIYTQRAKGGPILGSIIGVHLIFCLILKFVFYHQY